MSLLGALSSATRALEVYSTAAQVAGNNIANANTPGYIRDELILDSERPFQRNGLLVGGGVKSASVRQEIDQYLEKRIQAANLDAESAKARNDIFKQLELEIRELGDNDLSSRFSKFVASLNEVVNQPEQGPLRSDVIEQGKLIATELRDLRHRLDQLRETQTTRITDLVNEGNRLIDEVEQLNSHIASLEANGLVTSEAGSLRSQRYQALNRLSQIFPVNYVERENGVVDLYSGSDYVLISNRAQHLVTETKTDRGALVTTVHFDKSRTELSQAGGELKGVVEARDEILGGFIDDLDQLAGTFIFEFNKIHSSGEGLTGFTTITSERQLTDTDVPLNAANLPFTPQHGSFTLKVKNQRTGVVESTQIAIDLDGIGGNDTSLEDLRAAIDSIDNVSATINTLGALKLEASNEFEFSFLNDTSGVLAALGINTFFTGATSSSIAVSDLINSDQRYLATGQGGGPSDNSNALRLAQIMDQSIATLGSVSLGDFYDSVVSGIGQGSAAEEATYNGLESFRDSLLSQREQFSGVSLDEEAVRLIQAQEAFAASARVIKTIDDMFQTILGL